jgi:alcohol dehydrogenase (NADP+)
MMNAPEDVQSALTISLSDLQLSYLDLYLIHWPVVFTKGTYWPASAKDMLSLDVLPIAKTLQALESMVDMGLCRHLGVSNFSIAKLKKLVDSVRIKPEINQIELHPYFQQSAMLEFCSRNEVHVTAYSPLGSPGMRSEGKKVLLEDPVVESIATKREGTPAQVLISWAIQRGTAVVPKSTHPLRIKQNLDSTKLSLSAEDLQEIAGIDQNLRYFDGSFFVFEDGPYSLKNIWDE